MTENKRFKFSYSLEKVYDCDSFNGETTESYGTFECCDLLNKLNDENEELKKEVKQLKNKIKTYNNTHELLKKTIDRLRNNE